MLIRNKDKNNSHSNKLSKTEYITRLKISYGNLWVRLNVIVIKYQEESIVKEKIVKVCGCFKVCIKLYSNRITKREQSKFKMVTLGYDQH